MREPKYCAATLAVPPLGEQPSTLRKGICMYQKPAVERFGTLREITQAGGTPTPGDPSNTFHRS